MVVGGTAASRARARAHFTVQRSRTLQAPTTTSRDVRSQLRVVQRVIVGGAVARGRGLVDGRAPRCLFWAVYYNVRMQMQPADINNGRLWIHDSWGHLHALGHNANRTST